MPTMTVKLDKKRARRVARWARHSKVTRSQILRDLIDRAGPILTGDDLVDWAAQAEGRGFGWAPRER